MKLIIKQNVVQNIFLFEITLLPNSEELALFNTLGEPFIDISFGDTPKRLNKLYSESPFLITNSSQSELISHKNELIEKIKDAITELKTRKENIILEDEVIEF